MKNIYHNEERIIYIVYHDGIPHEVTTVSEKGYCSYYNFDYFYGNKKDIRWYKSGGGGHMTELYGPHYIKGTTGVTYWMSDDAKFRNKPKNCTRIEKPLRVKGWRSSSINPFKAADETSNYGYCDRCNQHVQGECSEHQYWDDESSCVRYYDNNEIAE